MFPVSRRRTLTMTNSLLERHSNRKQKTGEAAEMLKPEDDGSTSQSSDVICLCLCKNSVCIEAEKPASTHK